MLVGVFVGVGLHMAQSTYGVQRSSFEDGSLSAMWDLVIGLRSSGLGASAFTPESSCWPTSGSDLF